MVRIISYVSQVNKEMGVGWVDQIPLDRWVQKNNQRWNDWTMLSSSDFAVRVANEQMVLWVDVIIVRWQKPGFSSCSNSNNGDAYLTTPQDVDAELQDICEKGQRYTEQTEKISLPEPGTVEFSRSVRYSWVQAVDVPNTMRKTGK